MPALGAGETYTVLEPVVAWAPLGSTPPHVDTRYNDIKAVRNSIGGVWREIVDTVNGIAVTKRNPKTPVPGERFGRLGMVSSGDEGVGIGLQLSTPEMNFLDIIASMSKKVVAATSVAYGLTISVGATTAGNVTITLPGLAPVDVALLATDTTPALVATKIRAAAFTGWTTGGTGGVVTFTKTATGRVLGTATFAPNATGVVGSLVSTQEGHVAFTTRAVDKSATNQFMLYFHGVAEAGSLFEMETEVSAVAFAAENTANTEMPWRWSGLDAVVRPNLTLEANPAQVTAAQLVGSGLRLEDIDNARKFNYIEKLKAA